MPVPQSAPLELGPRAVERLVAAVDARLPAASGARLDVDTNRSTCDDTSIATNVGPGSVPNGLRTRLHAVAPNPFNPKTTIRFELPRSGHARLSVHALDGRLVARLQDGLLDAGRHRVVWRGRDDAGRALPSGTYLYRLQTGGVSVARGDLSFGAFPRIREPRKTPDAFLYR